MDTARPCFVAPDVSIEENVFSERNIPRIIGDNGIQRAKILLTEVSKSWRNLQKLLSLVAMKRVLNGAKRSLSLSLPLSLRTHSLFPNTRPKYHDEIYVVFNADGTDIWMPG